MIDLVIALLVFLVTALFLVGRALSGLESAAEVDAVNCSACGNAMDQTESWPDEQGPICQTCWEAVCAAAWWQAVSK